MVHRLKNKALRFIPPKVHGFIDYVLIIFWGISPLIFNIGHLSTYLYIFSSTLLVISMLTNYPGGVFRFLSFPFHGWVEFLLGVALTFLPWIAGFSENYPSKVYSVTFGIVILLFWIFTDYRQTEADDFSSSGKVQN